MPHQVRRWEYPPRETPCEEDGRDNPPTSGSSEDQDDLGNEYPSCPIPLSHANWRSARCRIPYQPQPLLQGSSTSAEGMIFFQWNIVHKPPRSGDGFRNGPRCRCLATCRSQVLCYRKPPHHVGVWNAGKVWFPHGIPSGQKRRVQTFLRFLQHQGRRLRR